ncbi:hypothetical protein [Pectinatus frisingensis]|nr:hypothetical protein [Pectinatus frisingensis]
MEWFVDWNGIEAVMTLLVILAVICVFATLLLPEPKEKSVAKEANIK